MYYFLVNPASRSGKGLLVWKKVESYLKEQKIPYRVSFSEHEGHVQELVKGICGEYLEGASPVNLILMGGDGTLDEALQGIVDFSRINIGYIPTGSGNDFARSFEYSEDPIVSLKHILSVKMPRLIDIGELTYENVFEAKKAIERTRLFAVSTGIGYDAAVCAGAMRSKAKNFLNRLGLGKLIYTFVGIKLIFSKDLHETRLVLDDGAEVFFKKCRFIVGMNTKYEGGGFKFAPDASCDDGLIDVLAVGDIEPWDVIKLLPQAMNGRHTKDKHVHMFKVKSFEVETEKPLYVHTDGEVYAKSGRIKVQVLPKKLRFLY